MKILCNCNSLLVALRLPGSPGIVRHETKKYGIFGVIQEKFMTSAEAIERAIEQLPPDELSKFRRWFLEFDAAIWDAQIETDAAAGKFDALAEEALKEYRSGKAREM
jgi:hypothetical protein